MKTVAEKCAEKFDEDLLEDAFLKNELFDYFKTMRLFEVKLETYRDKAESSQGKRYITSRVLQPVSLRSSRSVLVKLTAKAVNDFSGCTKLAHAIW